MGMIREKAKLLEMREKIAARSKAGRKVPQIMVKKAEALSEAIAAKDGWGQVVSTISVPNKNRGKRG